MWKLTSTEVEMLARVMEGKDKVWSCFASVGNNVIIPKGTVWDEPASKVGKWVDNQEDFACNMQMVSQAQRRGAWDGYQTGAGALIRCCRLLCILVSPKWLGNSMRCTLEFPASFPPPPLLTAAGIDEGEIRTQFKSSSGEASAHAVV